MLILRGRIDEQLEKIAGLTPLDERRKAAGDTGGAGDGSSRR
ncbi:hypothetical protein ACWC98_39100 [Streptomyces goshikiensis]